MNIFTKIFSKQLEFEPIDPLADGLGEEIFAEQCEPQAINFNDTEASENLQQFWSKVETDIHSGGAIDFSEE